MFTPEYVFYADIMCSAATAGKSLVFIILVFDIPSVKWIEKKWFTIATKAVSQNIKLYLINMLQRTRATKT